MVERRGRGVTVVQEPPADASVSPADLITEDEAIARYPDKWILFDIIDRGRGNQSHRGIVLGYGDSHGGMWKLATRLDARAKGRKPAVHVFFGRPYGRTGEDLRKAIAELQEQDDISDIWRW